MCLTYLQFEGGNGLLEEHQRGIGERFPEGNGAALSGAVPAAAPPAAARSLSAVDVEVVVCRVEPRTHLVEL